MTVQQAFERLRKIQQELFVYNYAMNIIHYDADTVAPPASYVCRGEVLSAFTEKEYEITTGDEMKSIVAFLIEHKDELDGVQKREVELLNKEAEYVSSIPKDEYVAFTSLLNEASVVWHNAKANNDFESFRPFLEKIVDYNRRFAKYYKPDKDPYDTLLDQYEEGLNKEQADNFFNTLKEHIVPLLKKVTEAPQPDTSFLHKHYPKEKQAELSEYVMAVMGIDKQRCILGTTEHPFTTNVCTSDVRITTHYYEDDLASAFYSTVHEGGHALYELGVDPAYEKTPLTGGVSMGIHECQSRFFENLIGRSRAFIGFVFPKMKELFPEQLEGVTAEDFYKAVNKAQPSLIRTEADELTYALHVLIRYEIEKELIAERLEVKDVPQVWNAKYKEYLGVDVPDDTHGVLQDSHWSGGSIGYFPSYALGSAYGAQIFAKMNSEMDVYGEVASGNLAKVEGWLRENIFRHGSRYSPKTLFESCVGSSFDPIFFTDYLENKFSDIYGLDK